jgi:transposase-like protein
MRKKRKYSADFKLNLVKEYLSSEKSQTQIAEENDVPPSVFARWVSKYNSSNCDDDVFNTKKGRPVNMISDYSKIPPVVYEAVKINKNTEVSNNEAQLKQELDLYKKILLEKELECRILKDERDMLKKNLKKN